MRLALLGGRRFQGLFNQFGVAEVGFSTRLLDRNHSDGLIRAVAESGGTQFGSAIALPYRVAKDDYRLDLNSTLEDLDATAIGRGLTTSDTVGDLLLSGTTNYNGKLHTYVNQGSLGSSVNLVQTSLANMATFATAGALLVENAKPKTTFSGNQWADGTGINQGLNDYSYFSVMKSNNSADWVAFSNGGSVTNEGGVQLFGNSANRYRSALWDNGSSSIFHAPINFPDFSVISLIGDRDVLSSFYRNGTLQNTADISSFSAINLVNDGTFTIGRGFAFVFRYFTGDISELIFYNSNKNAIRTSVEDNQITYWGI